MSKHTPGPWTAIPDSDGEGDWYVVGAEEEVVAIGLTEPAARLIAAAPDLLAVAKIFERYLADNGGDEQFHNADGTGWLTIARAAIAKAEGVS